MTANVDIETEGPLLIVRFSNPPEGYMDDNTGPGLIEAIERLESDPALRVAILTGGQPGVFIRHFDVRPLEALGRKLREKGYVFTENRPTPEPEWHATLRRMETCHKPIIAALNGTAMGGGFEIALACDLRIAQRGDHWYGLPEANVGLLPGAGGTQRLPRLIGEAKALEFMLTGRTVGPEDAARLGLVSAVADDALEAAREMAAELIRKPAKALAHIKRLTRRPADPEMLAIERTLFCDVAMDDDAIELMAAMNAGGDIRNPKGDA